MFNPFQELRKQIAQNVEDKMTSMGSCPNEMDIILWVIDPKNHPRHDCFKVSCPTFQLFINDKIIDAYKKLGINNENTKC